MLILVFLLRELRTLATNIPSTAPLTPDPPLKKPPTGGPVLPTRSIQEGLAAQANDWVDLQRNFSANESGEVTTNGTSEISMRNQFRAWRELMAAQ